MEGQYETEYAYQDFDRIWKNLISKGEHEMETMYNRIRRMSESEMNDFIRWIFLAGKANGCIEYFENIVSQNAEDVMRTMKNALKVRYHF